MRALIAVIAVLLTTVPARADLLQADFSGIAVGTSPVCPNCGFSNAPFHAVFVFDTGGPLLPGPGTFNITGSTGFINPPPNPLLSAVLTVGDPVVFERALWSDGFGLNSLLDWQADEFGNLTVLRARSQGGFVQLTLQPTFGSYTTGVCPSIGFASCSQLVVTSSSLAAVPGPIVGSGLPGLALLAGWWWTLRRRK